VGEAIVVAVGRRVDDDVLCRGAIEQLGEVSLPHPLPAGDHAGADSDAVVQRRDDAEDLVATEEADGSGRSATHRPGPADVDLHRGGRSGGAEPRSGDR
jgi:hypothetical protein